MTVVATIPPLLMDNVADSLMTIGVEGVGKDWCIRKIRYHYRPDSKNDYYIRSSKQDELKAALDRNGITYRVVQE